MNFPATLHTSKESVVRRRSIPRNPHNAQVERETQGRLIAGLQQAGNRVNGCSNTFAAKSAIHMLVSILCAHEVAEHILIEHKQPEQESEIFARPI